MKNPLFSVIIPVYSELQPIQAGASGQTHFRAKTVQRAIKSIMSQQFPDWELIIVDDKSVDDITPRVLDSFAKVDKRITVIHNEFNIGRSAAQNLGMKHAKGEWICWLDSDDEYSTTYLRDLARAIKEFPDYKIFNFGSLIHWPDYHSEVRQAFKPAHVGKGTEWFRSGHIGCGSFIFKRELWNSNKKYHIPDNASPYGFAAESKIPLKLDPVKDKWQYENTENPTGAFQDGVLRHGMSLGNPVGNDYAQFYYLTRDNHSKPLDMYLYIQYPRTSEDVQKHFGEVFDTGIA
jgi:glycosyltransferase involved in cell wall biosynthesis